MIDFHKESKPVYYYYVVNDEDYNNLQNEYNLYGEVSYDLSKFVRMGSTSGDNNYNDNDSNNTYYQNGMAIEEFIFMVDFKDANIEDDVLDKSLLLEMRNGDNQTLISVLGIEQENMKYNIYNNKDAVIELNGSLSDNTIYLGKSTTLNFDTKFTQSTALNNSIYDTRYDDQKLGVKLSIYDSNGNLLNSSSLMGVNFTYNGNTYYPRYNGTVRINVAEKRLVILNLRLLLILKIVIYLLENILWLWNLLVLLMVFIMVLVLLIDWKLNLILLIRYMVLKLIPLINLCLLIRILVIILIILMLMCLILIILLDLVILILG